MISEGSCDTGDWSNDAEHLALITGINYISKRIQIESSYFKKLNISQYYCFCCILDLKNAEDNYIEKIRKRTVQTLLTGSVYIHIFKY